MRREDNDSGLALASVGDFLVARFFIARLHYGRRRCVCKRRNAGSGGRFVWRVFALAGEEISENAGEGAIGVKMATIFVRRGFFVCVLQAFCLS